jgi:hypothetical protein
MPPPIVNPPAQQKDPSTGIMNLAAPFVGDAVNGLISLFTAKRNRQNALDDWNRQNEYNSPAAQMQRYKDAGLSPNLIYGQTNTAAPIRSTDMVAPQIDTKNVDYITRSQNINQQRLATDLLQKQIEVQDANIRLIDANTTKAYSETNWKNVNTKNLEGLLPYNLDIAHERARNLAQATTNMYGSNERAWQMLPKLKEKLDADTSVSQVRKSEILARTNQITSDITWKNLSEPKRIAALSFINENLLNNINRSTDKISLEKMRLQLAQDGITGNIATKILSLFK